MSFDPLDDRLRVLQALSDTLKRHHRMIERDLLITRVMLGAMLAVFVVAVFNIFF